MPEKTIEPARSLVLFDIDGTLIRRAGPHHREALVEAIRAVTGLETTTDGIPLHGMLDPQIILQMMHRVNASASLMRRSLPEIARKAEEIYEKSCPALETKVCPGARKTLERLVKAGVRLGLVTGNLTKIGWTKLERAGLYDFFEFGAFGGMSAERSGLVRLAIQHAHWHGWAGEQTKISLIGDAPADIRAAQAHDITSIAVATGVVPPEDLKRYSPDILLDDLRDLTLEMVL